MPGIWDIGLSHFSGTGREPLFIAALTPEGELVLRPWYQLVEQSGLDVQATLNNWLWKLEAVRRSSGTELYGAATAGFEYTRYGIAGSAMDIGWVMEYLYDSRGQQATAPFADDLMLGVRLSSNDIAGTEFLFGVIGDVNGAARFYSIEGSRRVDDHVRVELEGRFLSGMTEGESLYSLRDDDYLELSLGYYF